jgi:cob(I)alamin adenosyltransferase
MRKKKAARDKIMATKTEEKGLLIVHTGKGKGKSTAAFGMVFRAIGHGFRSASCSSSRAPGRPASATCSTNFPEQVTINAMGEGFTWDVADRQRDLAAARNAWEQAKALIADPKLQAGAARRTQHRAALRLPADRRDRRDAPQQAADTHVIVTGRNAKDELIEIADLVTEMTEIKHPFRSGVKAQPGIEF